MDYQTKFTKRCAGSAIREFIARHPSAFANSCHTEAHHVPDELPPNWHVYEFINNNDEVIGFILLEKNDKDEDYGTHYEIIFGKISSNREIHFRKILGKFLQDFKKENSKEFDSEGFRFLAQIQNTNPQKDRVIALLKNLGFSLKEEFSSSVGYIL